MEYHVYIVECRDGTYYTGIAKNIDKRLEEHNASAKGARYTRTRRPVSLKYCEAFESRSLAQAREAAIKKLAREEKKKLINRQGGSVIR